MLDLDAGVAVGGASRVVDVAVVGELAALLCRLGCERARDVACSFLGNGCLVAKGDLDTSDIGPHDGKLLN